MTPFLRPGCFKTITVCVSLHVDSERLIYFRFCIKIYSSVNSYIVLCTLQVQDYIYGLQVFFIGPRNILYCSVVYVRQNYHDGEEDADGCNAEY
jgi:hypothetical protein